MQSLFFSILTASAITAAVPPSPGRLEDERCVFVSAHLPAASPPLREKWQTLRLKPKILDDAARMPPESLLRLFVAPGPVVRTPIQSSLSQLTDGRIKRLDSGIQIDAEGLDERWRELKGPGPHVVNWFAGGRFVQLLLFERGRDWWVASAMAAEAKSRDASFLLLDGDANGSWWDAHDFVSFMGGALRPLGGVDRVDDGTRRGRIRLAGSNGAVSLQFQPSERPEGLDDDQWLALNAANEQRNRHGLPPLLVWREVNEGLLAHTRFLHQHAPMKEGPLNSYYGEPDGMEGRSDAGAEASRSGCVAFLTESMTIAGHVASCITMTQSRFQVFAPGAARFGAARTQRWSFFRAQEGPCSGARYLVLPAAGSRDLPRACGSNWPFPRSFPDLYASPRGLPISVSMPKAQLIDGSTLRVRSIALFTLPERREVPGFFFSIRDIDQAATDHTFFFIAGDPLAAEQDYLVQAAIEATRKGEGGVGMTVDVDLLQWQFRTDR